VAYPEHVQAIVLRDTSADATNLKLAYENARNQDRVAINWDNFKLHAPNEFLRLRRIHEGMRAWDALLTSMADGPRRLQPACLPDLTEARA
jgi:hypothetical protein